MIRWIEANAKQRVHNHETWSYHICTHENFAFVYNFMTPFKPPSVPKKIVGLQGIITKFSLCSNLPLYISKNPLPTIHVEKPRL
jgi:hypothetical protein